MSIREVTMYRIECDAPDCTKSPVDGSEYVAWSDQDGALCDLDDAWDWYNLGGVHFCPAHAPTCGHADCLLTLRDDEFGSFCEDHYYEVHPEQVGGAS